MTAKQESDTRRDFITASAWASALALGAGSLARPLRGQEEREPVEINAMGPTAEQIQAFLALPERPVVMVNLLKFKPDGGTAEYMKYGQAVQPLLAKVGARSLFAGQAATCLIGQGDWDMVALVEYPKPAALLEMAGSPEYQAIHHHREAGLEGQVNYAVFQA